jgi:hypothetical protein
MPAFTEKNYSSLCANPLARSPGKVKLENVVVNRSASLILTNNFNVISQ